MPAAAIYITSGAGGADSAISLGGGAAIYRSSSLARLAGL